LGWQIHPRGIGSAFHKAGRLLFLLDKIYPPEAGGDESYEDNPALPEKNKLDTKFGVA